MSKLPPRVIAASLALSSTLCAGAALAGPTVSISNVRWALANPGGVGTFTVTVKSTGAAPAKAVWPQAVSPGATTIQGGAGAFTKANAFTSTALLAPTAGGRCYTITLGIEPDSAVYGIIIDPKLGSRRVCLDPDGKGIIPGK